MGEGLLFRLEWDADTDGLLRALVDVPVRLLAGTYRDGLWTLRLRAVDRAAISTFQDACVAAGVSLTLSRLGPLADAAGHPEAGLTAAQIEALELAHRRGYFDDARKATLDDLSAELGISRQALAGRLQRGHRNLLGTLFASTDGGPIVPRIHPHEYCRVHNKVT